MTPPFARVSGDALGSFVAAVRAEYEACAPYDQFTMGLRQPNTLRLTACRVLEDLPAQHKAAIVGDLFIHNEGLPLLRMDSAEVFREAGSVDEYIFDLICEVAWQVLAHNDELRIEDEIRLALVEA